MDEAADMRRLFGSCGGAVRQDVLVAGDADGRSGGDRGREARLTSKKAEKEGVGQKRRDGAQNVSGDKVKGDVRTLNGFNRHAGLRNRCYTCDGEYARGGIRPEVN